MRQDTPFGPIWLIHDFMPSRAAMHSARLELLWPDLDGFIAMHTGPHPGGAWVVRAPMAALEKAGYRTDSAAEHAVREGTVWPPIHIPVPGSPEELYREPQRRHFPWKTPEQLYHEDRERMNA